MKIRIMLLFVITLFVTGCANLPNSGKIYVLCSNQECLKRHRVLPGHDYRCDKCGTIFRVDSKGWTRMINGPTCTTPVYDQKYKKAKAGAAGTGLLWLLLR